MIFAKAFVISVDLWYKISKYHFHEYFESLVLFYTNLYIKQGRSFFEVFSNLY